MLDVTVKGGEQLRRVAAALRRADREDLRRQLAKAMRDAAKPTVEAIKESARNIHTTGEEKASAKRRFTVVVPAKGTRAKIAAAVVADVRVDEDNPRVRFRVGASRLPTTLKNMPRKFDGDHWRHPVMGNREAWVGQSADPWFWPPIRDHIRTFRAEISDALDRTAEQIERA